MARQWRWCWGGGRGRGVTEVLECHGPVREAGAAELCRVLPDDRLRHGEQRLGKFVRLEGARGMGWM